MTCFNMTRLLSNSITQVREQRTNKGQIRREGRRAHSQMIDCSSLRQKIMKSVWNKTDFSLLHFHTFSLFLSVSVSLSLSISLSLYRWKNITTWIIYEISSLNSEPFLNLEKIKTIFKQTVMQKKLERKLFWE
jgi:hypothetical protein